MINNNIIKNQTYQFLLFCLMMCIGFLSCSEELDDDTTAPPLPKNILQIGKIAGGAVLKYDVPTDKDLLYVQARYFANQTERYTKATPFENTLTISGLGEVKEHDVWICAADKSGNKSEEVKVTVVPDTSAKDVAFGNFVAKPTFGGLFIEFQNDSKQLLYVETLAKDSMDLWKTIHTQRSKKQNENYVVKEGVVIGDSATEYRFLIKDRWGNTSDPFVAHIKPFFEEKINSEHITHVQYEDDDDSWPGHYYYAKHIFDGISDNNNHYIYHSGPNTTMPISLTFDLGTDIKISSYKIFPRHSYEYTNHCLKSWQIWGRADAPPETTDASPDFSPSATDFKEGDVYANVPGDSGWTLISQETTNRPSGPDGDVTADDKAHAHAGENHTVPLDIASSKNFRYIRLCIQSTYSNVHGSIAEMELFGEYQGEKPSL